MFSSKHAFYISHFSTRCYELFPKSHYRALLSRGFNYIRGAAYSVGEGFSRSPLLVREMEFPRVPGARVNFSESVLFQCSFKTIAELRFKSFVDPEYSRF